MKQDRWNMWSAGKLDDWINKFIKEVGIIVMPANKMEDQNQDQ